MNTEAGRIDILVNSAWGGYEQMVENGAFTWMLPFHQQPAHRWAAMIDAGVRPAFVCPGTRRAWVAADAALRHGTTDIDGRQPQPLRIENFLNGIDRLVLRIAREDCLNSRLQSSRQKRLGQEIKRRTSPGDLRTRAPGNQ